MTANRPRPAIPDSVKIAVATRQLIGRVESGFCARTPGETLVIYRERILSVLAIHLGVARRDLRLDHDPPLRWRKYNARIKNKAARYTPNANDPSHLIYRTDVEHKLKTNVRGDGAQHPDRVLIKKERRRERGPKKKRTSFSRPINRSKNGSWPQGRRIQNTNRWPKKRER